MNIKCLPLDIKITESFFSKYNNKQPLGYMPFDITKPGWYLYGDFCWRVMFGKAYTSDKKDFQFELLYLKVLSLDSNQVNALKAIVKSGLANKEQKKLHANLYLIDSKRDNRYRWFKFKKDHGLK